MIGAAFGVVLARAQAGDEAAFARLFADVQPALLRYLRVITPEADDVAGDTWLHVVTGLRGFRGEEEAFRAWLFTIARHRAADAARSRARRPAVPVAVPEAAQGLTAQGLTAQGLTAGPPLAPDAADLALDGISARAVVALIATLPRDQAEVVDAAGGGRAGGGRRGQDRGQVARRGPGGRASRPPCGGWPPTWSGRV